MRFVASLTALTLVLALASCDSSTSSGSSSPLVGTWVYNYFVASDTASNGSPFGTSQGVKFTFIFSNTDSLSSELQLITIANGDTLLDDSGLTERGSWKATASKIYATINGVVDTMPYTVIGDTLQLFEASPAGGDSILDYIRQ